MSIISTSVNRIFSKNKLTVNIEKQIPRGKKMWVFDKSGNKVHPENKTSL